jgi:hypothetical protein
LRVSAESGGGCAPPPPAAVDDDVGWTSERGDVVAVGVMGFTRLLLVMPGTVVAVVVGDGGVVIFAPTAGFVEEGGVTMGCCRAAF